MKCAVHPEVDATGYCRNCGKPVCAECAREVRGAIYDENCLAAMLAGPQVGAVPIAPGVPGAPFQPVVRDSRPGTALALGFIPGLGAVYNGEYVKAIIHVLIFAGMIAALSSDLPAGMDAFMGIALGCFYFYMPIEAYRVAKARVEGQPEPASSGEQRRGEIADRRDGADWYWRVVAGQQFQPARRRLVQEVVAGCAGGSGNIHPDRSREETRVGDFDG